MSNSVLTKKLRPKNLDEVWGQDAVVSELRTRFAKGFVPDAFMFTGDSGSGKTTLARIVMLLIQKGELQAKLTTEDWNDFNFLDIKELNASNVNGIDDMRELVKGQHLYPMPPSLVKGVILDEAHRLSKQAQDLLLKATEDPGSFVWILITNKPEDLLPELQRRFTRFNLTPLDEPTLAKMLEHYAKQEGLTADCAGLAKQLALCDVTTPAHALQALEKHACGASINEAVNAAGGDVVIRDLTKKLLKGEWFPLAQAFSTMSNEDIKSFRHGCLKYLRKTVLAPNHSRQRQASEMIQLLTEDVPYDDNSLVAWITSRVFQITNPKTIQQQKAA